MNNDLSRDDNRDRFPDVSIIVPVYNVEEYLGECVESLLAQTLGSYEVILVDDGSTDSSGRMCDDFAAAHPDKIRVIHQPNGRQAAARNAGIDAARGRYVGFVDSDDMVLPGMFGEMVKAMESKDVDVVVSRCIPWEKGHYVVSRKVEAAVVTGPELLKKCFEWEIDGAVYTKLFKREVIGDIRFVVGNNQEDLLFLTDIFLKPLRVYILPEGHYMYRDRPGSVTTKFRPAFFDIMKNIDYVGGILPEDNKELRDAFQLYSLWYNIISGTKIVRARMNRQYKNWLRHNRRFILRHWRMMLTHPKMTNRWRLKALYAFLRLP